VILPAFVLRLGVPDEQCGPYRRKSGILRDGEPDAKGMIVGKVWGVGSVYLSYLKMGLGRGLAPSLEEKLNFSHEVALLVISERHFFSVSPVSHCNASKNCCF